MLSLSPAAQGSANGRYPTLRKMCRELRWPRGDDCAPEFLEGRDSHTSPTSVQIFRSTADMRSLDPYSCQLAANGEPWNSSHKTACELRRSRARQTEAAHQARESYVSRWPFQYHFSTPPALSRRPGLQSARGGLSSEHPSRSAQSERDHERMTDIEEPRLVLSPRPESKPRVLRGDPLSPTPKQ